MACISCSNQLFEEDCANRRKGQNKPHSQLQQRLLQSIRMIWLVSWKITSFKRVLRVYRFISLVVLWLWVIDSDDAKLWCLLCLFYIIDLSTAGDFLVNRILTWTVHIFHHTWLGLAKETRPRVRKKLWIFCFTKRSGIIFECVFQFFMYMEKRSCGREKFLGIWNSWTCSNPLDSYIRKNESYHGRTLSRTKISCICQYIVQLRTLLQELRVIETRQCKLFLQIWGNCISEIYWPPRLKFESFVMIYS